MLIGSQVRKVRRDTGGTWESLDSTRLLMHTSGSKTALLCQRKEAARGPEANHCQAACGNRLTRTAYAAVCVSDKARRPRTVSQNSF